MKHIFTKPMLWYAGGLLAVVLAFPAAYYVVFHLTAAAEFSRFNREAGRDASLADDMTTEKQAEKTRKLLDRNAAPLPPKQPK